MGRPHTTIGAERFHFRVRNGIGWFPHAIAARQTGLGKRGRIPFLAPGAFPNSCWKKGELCPYQYLQFLSIQPPDSNPPYMPSIRLRSCLSNTRRWCSIEANFSTGSQTHLIDQSSMNELDCQDSVDLFSIIRPTRRVRRYHVLQRSALKIWTGSRPWIKKNLLNVLR